MQSLPSAKGATVYTKAAIAGHPIHPMLVAFPVAFYTGTVVALLASIATHDPFWYRVAFWANLAGVVMAAVAAIPGAVDLFGSVPRKTKARVTGLVHATLNVAALVLFVLSVIILGNSLYGAGGQLNVSTPLVLTIIGALVTVAAGALGWTMVQTHHVGIKPTEALTEPRARDQVEDLDELVMPPREPLPGHAALH
jgi:uncharacterized membrane protein